MTRIFHTIGGRKVPICGLILAGLVAVYAWPARAGESPAASTNSAAAAGLTAGTNSAAVTNDPEGDKAWAETSKALQPPMIPAAWRTNAPTPEEEAAFYEPMLTNAVDKAHDFYTRFPNHPKAEDAKRMEFNLLGLMVNKYHDTNQVERLAELRKAQSRDPNVGEDDRFRLRLEEVEKAAMAKKDQGEAAVFAELEKGARELLKEFPKRQEIYMLLMEVASESSPDKARALVTEVRDHATDEQLKDMAAAELKTLETLGKPVEIQYTAVDGRQVDLAKMKGKVVLVDFWATWCMPCVAELPEVKAVYDKLHGKGFEIVGISLDQDEEALRKFVKEKKMTWPQFFDGGGGPNRIAAEYGVYSIPAMWLVDKKGNLNSLNARGGLEDKVTGLLKE